MRSPQIAVDAGDSQVFGNVNFRLLQPAQKPAAVVERNVGILHAREPLSSFLADQLALPYLATVRVAVVCIAHGCRKRRVHTTHPPSPSLARSLFPKN
jgi:hypothetical protein